MERKASRELKSITPVLIVAFNRPKHLKILIDSLRETQHQIIRISIDGPRDGNLDDQTKIRECLEYVNEINWTTNIKIYHNRANLKPRFAIPNAVNAVLDEFEKIIVFEDDVEINMNTIEYFEWCLNKYKYNLQIGHISGYSNAPYDEFPKFEESHRLSIFPESYAWATWSNRWKLYEDNVNSINLKKLFKENESYFSNVGKFGKVSWSLEKANTSQNYISTWAYRWMFTLWKYQIYSVSPNINLVKYNGHSEGTHVRTKQRWKEIVPGISRQLNMTDSLRIIPEVEKWSSVNVYRDNFLDTIKLLVISFIFRLFPKIRKILSMIKS
jgi:hypothetical protein